MTTKIGTKVYAWLHKNRICSRCLCRETIKRFVRCEICKERIRTYRKNNPDKIRSGNKRCLAKKKAKAILKDVEHDRVLRENRKLKKNLAIIATNKALEEQLKKDKK